MDRLLGAAKELSRKVESNEGAAGELLRQAESLQQELKAMRQVGHSALPPWEWSACLTAPALPPPSSLP